MTADSTYLPHCAGPCRCNAGTITDADGSVEHVQGEDCDCFSDDAGSACVHCGAALSTQPPPVYAWRRRSLTTEHAATITLARRTDGCECPIPWPPETGDGSCRACGRWLGSDLLLVVDSPQDRRRRLFALDGAELPHGLDFEEVPVGDPQITSDLLLKIERGHDLVLPPDARGWDLERMWGEP